ncbi:hypothetical protein PFTANZ_03823 [Plasmodium falciparum Tanzania (2000708)]|uniref:Duffy-binding-like domain-containing protein n=1 Tax=Plasmodium falciparum Tanzania (2000708) TaxID=1036725 RepID=A0A024W3E8_PLAFA|nr:hypothetical protein PFTANZ_03823 [Plasmodium falciparum Tanzania (2000708)]
MEDTKKSKSCTDTCSRTARDVLEEFGGKIQEIAHTAALGRGGNKLQGDLSKARFKDEINKATDPCQLDHQYNTNVTDGFGKDNPCDKRSPVRFSDKYGGQCTNKKIKGNDVKNGKDIGACAPFRRLFLCDHHLSYMKAEKINTKDNLLLEVCYAAKYEGKSLKNYHAQYQANNTDFKTNICTALARSFADIGDIIRGKDLFIGYNERDRNEKKQLQDSLKNIFGKIYEKLENTDVQKHYEGDKGNYYELREDWWNANRHDVWKAITCGAGENDTYSINTGNGNMDFWNEKCGHNEGIVPTNLDYVPQFLRWFNEWAEDFCRKKKKKVENLEKSCRGQDKSGNERYCSLNGYDCEQTIRKIELLRMGKGCTDCLYACNPYVEWIDKKKEEFDKQVKKYDEEIKKKDHPTTITIKTENGNTTINNLYVKEFYEQLQSGYKDVNDFLKKLSEERICKDKPQVLQEKADPVDFTKQANTTFSHTEYCQPCPICGVKHNGNKWEPKQKHDKCNIKLYKPRSGAIHTDINFLYSGDRHEDIKKKLNAFCDQTNRGTTNAASGGGSKSDSQKLYQEWKCYQFDQLEKDQNPDGVEDEVYEKDVQNGGGLCILKKEKKIGEMNADEPAEIQKTFNPFFYYWVAHMLKDSIHWRTKRLKSCISNGAKIRCKNNNKCKTDCGCFEKWVEQKKNEWKPIKQHFYKQEAFKNKGENGEDKMLDVLMRCPDFVLQYNLREEFLKKDSTEDKENKVSAEEAKEIKHLRQMLQQAGVPIGDAALAAFAVSCIQGPVAEQKNIMDKLLDEEAKDATKCKNCEPLEEDKDLARSLPPADSAGAPDKPPDQEDHDLDHLDDLDDAEEEEEEKKEEKEEKATDDAVNGEVGPPQPPAPVVDVCETVKSALEGNLDDACRQKYAKNNSRLGWKCVTPSGDNTTTSGGGVTATDSKSAGQSRAKRGAEPAKASGTNQGSICVPPRRRRLYVTPLTKLTGETTAASVSQETSDQKTPSDNKLLEAFIQSAAIETFFLWDRYKKIKEKEIAEKKKKENDALDFLPSAASSGTAVPGMEALDHNGGPPQLTSKNSDDPQTQLQKGHIPPDFLRLMFYTLGDYRDLCVGVKDNDVIKALEASSDTKIIDISDKIKTVIENSVSTPSRAPPGKTSDKRVDWWNNNAKHIWEGMICALTYKENSEKTIVKDDTVYKKFFGENSESKDGSPVPQPGTNTGTYQSTYDYETVSFGASGTEAKTSGDTPLTQFVLRPPYFRYLEEWGETFCRERAKRLAQIYKDCRGVNNSGDPKYCSGDGHDCTENGDLNHNNMLADLDCPDCHIQCRKYRKWIDIKFEEYQNQKNKYEEEKQKLNGNSENKDYKKYYEEIQERTTAGKFLTALKHCKNNEGDGSDPNNKINFEEPLKTFGPLEYCKTCPPNKVNCRTRGRTDTKPCTPDNGNKWQSVFDKIRKNNENSTTIDVHMIDRRAPFIKNYLENSEKSQNSNHLFKTSSLFKGLSKQKWKCKVIDNNTDVCKLDEFKENIDLNEYITFKVLLHYWLEDFLYGYYLLKTKKLIEECTKRGKNTCDEETKKNCVCVKTWVEQKEKEWKEIKKHFKNRKPDDDEAYTIEYKVRTFFEKVPFDSAFINAIKGDKDIQDFEKFASCEDQDCYNRFIRDINHDFITKLLESLKTKAKTCVDTSLPRGNPQPTCVEIPPHSDEEENPLGDDPHTQMPPFCPKDVEDKKEPETDSDRLCDDKQEPKCNDFQKYTNSTCEPKKNLIGLGAHYHWAGSDYPNVYISPRVDQLCLQPLQELKEVNKNTSNVSELIEAFKKCAYNEGKGLYEYYNNNKSTIGKNDSPLSDEEVKTYTLEAMERSYADYSNIVKGDMYWNYENNNTVNEIIFSFADLYNTSNSSNFVRNIHENVKRLNLWKFIRAHVWKAMLCGYKDAIGGDINSLPNGVDLCTLPSTDKDNQFLRWFEEWGQNFCIRHEQELKRLKEKCEHIKCNGSNEVEKKICEKACEKYNQFLITFEKQYTQQSILYDELKSSIPELKHKSALEFLKYKCNSKCSCFKDKSDNYSDDVLNNLPNELKYKCNCESSPDNPFNILNECPSDNTKNSYCKNYNLQDLCHKSYSTNFYNWKIVRVKNKKNRNEIILIPPRRRHLCRIPFMGKWYYKNEKGEENLKKHIYTAAYSEGYRLSELYKSEPQKVLEVMKNSFADYANIIKGDDMLGTDIHKKLNVLLDKTKNPKTPEAWWETNKKHIWYAMLCGYQKGSKIEQLEKSWCSIPTEDGTHQFLRWVVEWAKEACKEKKIRENSLGKKCNCANQDEKSGLHLLNDSTCINELDKYLKFNILVKKSLEQLNIQYSINKTCLISEKTVEEYIKSQLKEDYYKPNQVDDNIYLDTYPDKYTVDNINPVDTHTNPNLVGNINPVDQNSNLTFPSNPNPAYDNIYIDHNNEDLPSKVQIEMSVKNTQMMEEKYPIGDVWDI